MKRALIFGVTGQDGSYLSELLLSKGYQVHGVMRRASTFNTSRIDHLYNDPHGGDTNFFLHFGDLTDTTTIRKILEEVQPDEIYNLAAQSHVRVSFDIPEYTFDVNAGGVLKLLEAIRDIIPAARLYQASSSEMFGSSPPPQNEQVQFKPCSPYAAAKVAAYYSVVAYRDMYNIFACNGILFNHESPRRAETFVTRKITRAASRISLGLQKRLYLGNLRTKRDWGFAGNFVEAMFLMLQHDQPDDYVIATGIANTVETFLKDAFDYVGLDWKNYVEFDPKYLRPKEVDCLLGDYSKAKNVLGWEPRTSYNQLLTMMMESDLRLARKEKVVGEMSYEKEGSEM